MRHRTWIAIVLTTAATAIAADKGPRTPDGHPDFSGIYDIATLTPLNRPGNVGGRLSLTEEEAIALAKANAEQLAKMNQKSDPNRQAPPKGGDGTPGAYGNVGGYNALWLDGGDRPFKIDGKYRTSIIVDPPNGRMPQMTKDAMARMMKLSGDSQPNKGDAWWIKAGVSPGPYDDPELRPTAERCLLGFSSSAGPPALPNYFYNNLKQIVQSKDTVIIVNEMIHDARVVRMNQKHEPPEMHRWLGDSVGRWEGDTLVVDTTNFNDQPAMFGASRNLHVIERFSRLDDKTLLYRFTIEDPASWTTAWTGEYIWPATDARIYEYACHEGNYSFGNILRGARQLEKEALKDRKK